jgi:S1-C subfamily serine protease
MKVFILIAILLAGSYAMDWESIYTKAKNNTCVIHHLKDDTVRYIGTGIIIAEETVLTCLHCAVYEKDVNFHRVYFNENYYDFVVIDSIKSRDLAILKVKGLKANEYPKIAKAKQGQLIMIYGVSGRYGFCFLMGYLMILEDKAILIDRPIFKGMSGSGVWDENGELVAIPQILAVDNYCIVTIGTELSKMEKWIRKVR